MANVSHASLTGTNLHEPKGIASAVANQCYVSNGSGSGVWQQVPAAAVTPTAIAFSAAMFQVREQQTSGTAGASPMTSGVWSQRVLTTVVTNDTGIPTLASNQVTLPAGTWMCMGYITGGMSTFNNAAVMRGKIWNVTATIDLIMGTSTTFGQFVAASSSTGQFTATSNVFGRFTLGVSSVLEVRAYQTGGFNGGYATAVPVLGGIATPEIYTDVIFWKVA